MMRLPLHVTHNQVLHQFPAVLVEYTRDSEGQAVANIRSETVMTGNMQPAGPTLQKLLPEGAETDGAKVLHTTDPVYVATNGRGLQTYIRHRGRLWKANAVEDWGDFSPIGRWMLTRHVDINQP